MAYVIGIAIAYFVVGWFAIALCKAAAVGDKMIEQAREEDDRA